MLGCSDSSKPARCRSAAMQCYPLVRIALSVRQVAIIVMFMPERVRIVSASVRVLMTAMSVRMTAMSVRMTAMSVRMTAMSVRMTAMSVRMTAMKLLVGRSASAPGLQAADVFSVGVTLLELWVGCLWHGAKTEPGCAKERVVALQKARRPPQRNVQCSARRGCHAMCCTWGKPYGALHNMATNRVSTTGTPPTCTRDCSGPHDRPDHRKAADRVPQPRAEAAADSVAAACAAQEGPEATSRVLRVSDLGSRGERLARVALSSGTAESSGRDSTLTQATARGARA